MADYLIELGSGAGSYGGQLLRSDMVEKNMRYDVRDYEYSVKSTSIDENDKIVLKGARANNLKKIDVSIPLRKLVCVIGVSGSGKSSLISRTLYPAIAKALGKWTDDAGEYDSISGMAAASLDFLKSSRPRPKAKRRH